MHRPGTPRTHGEAGTSCRGCRSTALPTGRGGRRHRSAPPVAGYTGARGRTRCSTRRQCQRPWLPPGTRTRGRSTGGSRLLRRSSADPAGCSTPRGNRRTPGSRCPRASTEGHHRSAAPLPRPDTGTRGGIPKRSRERAARPDDNACKRPHELSPRERSYGQTLPGGGSILRKSQTVVNLILPSLAAPLTPGGGLSRHGSSSEAALACAPFK